ncbi:MAG: response regulator, partial [Paracoccaceae bacterium]
MSLSGLKILLAEDNPTNQMVAVQMLESLGAEVTVAIDGAEALEILLKRVFDVALIDIEMPRISGIELIRRLRSMHDDVAAMPMIALTAYVMREHRIAIEDAGADGIIAKPILSIEQFGADILGHIRGRRATTGASTKVNALAGQGDTSETVQAAATMDVAVFDGLRSSFSGDSFLELGRRIESDITLARDRIDLAGKTHDMDEVRAASHILISVAGVIGATRLHNLAQCLNSAGHHSDIAEVEAKGSELVDRK